MEQNQQFFMQRALDLARSGQGHVHPNPLVGAIIVKEGRIIGEGAHQEYGGPHAEINALNSTVESPVGSTMYVNLEPCTYSGKTPPCVPAIIEAGIQHVVVGIQDPNPKVNGKGIRQLRDAGIVVEVGVMETECYEVNRGFISVMTTGNPWVTLKLALTIDGFMADTSGSSQWITGPESRRQVHRWRAEHNAILVGGGTVQTDDPSLTVRDVEGVNPIRVIVDPEGLAPESARVFTGQEAETILVTGSGHGNGRKNTFPDVETVSIQHSDNPWLPWEKIFSTMYQEKHILSVFVEGGARVASSLMQCGQASELIVMIGPKLLGQGLSPFGDLNLNIDEPTPWQVYEMKQYGDDVCIRYRKKK